MASCQITTRFANAKHTMKMLLAVLLIIIITIIVILLIILTVDIINGLRICKIEKKIVQEVQKVLSGRKGLSIEATFFAISVSHTSGTFMNNQEIFYVLKDKMSGKKININDNGVSKTVQFCDILKYVKSADDINLQNIGKGLDEALLSERVLGDSQNVPSTSAK